MSDLDIFIASVDDDIAWRKKEISNLLLMHNENNSELIVKASVLLIYSHWEGSIKNLCKLYLMYVSSFSIDISLLSNNFKAIALKGRIKQILESNHSLTMSNELEIINAIKDSDKKFRLNNNFRENDRDKSILNSKDNLSHKVFVNFLKIVGMKEKSCILSLKNYIDEKLLHNRNKIAHGNKIDPLEDEFDLDINSIKKLKDLIFSIIDSLGSDFKYYAENEFYLACNEEKANLYSLNSDTNLKIILDEFEL